MMNHEIRSHAEALEGRQYYRRPTVVGLTRAGIESGMVGIVCEIVFARDDDRSNFDGRIHSFHLSEIGLKSCGVGVRVVGLQILVRLPGAVVLIPDLPVLESVML